MQKNESCLYRKAVLVVLLITLISWSCLAKANRTNWKKQQVDWRMTGGRHIKNIKHPHEKPPLFLSKHKLLKQKKQPLAIADPALAPSLQQSAGGIFTGAIGSPPIDGFVPWIVVGVTNSRGAELELEAIPTTSIVGGPPPGYNMQTDYVIGILDTGASAHVMGNANAIQSGLFEGDPSLVSSNPIEVRGVTGSVDAWVSQPLGIFVDGLGAIDTSGNLSDTSGMVGQTNTSILVGQGGEPDLPTAIGSPLSVFFTTVLRNDQQITVTRDGQQFTAPTITLYNQFDPRIPTYSQIIPLELRPLGGLSVQYAPYINFYDIFEMDIFTLDFSTPQSPSVIMGNLSQSVLFVHSVDITENGKTALDRNRFMLDTGAQVTVIGSRVAARLGLNHNNPDFIVEIQGVTGDVNDSPGFYLDSLEIPALGKWLTFSDVPVILLDIPSPEGGTVDGIIGMNLLTDYNFVLRGGGLFLQDDPRLELEPIYRAIADIVPANGDGEVDLLDLAAFARAWGAIPISENWNAKADLYGDAKVNFLDFAVLAQNWSR